MSSGDFIASSVDFGRQGLAYCVADIENYPPTILDIGIVPDVPQINTAEKAVDVSYKLFCSLPKSRFMLLEAQPAINRMTLMLECALAGASRAGNPGYTKVVHVPVCSVKREFELPSGHDLKKKAATTVALDLLANPRCTVLKNKSVITNVLDASRRHDMADALLMIMWYARKRKGLLRHPGKDYAPSVRSSSDSYIPKGKNKKRQRTKKGKAEKINAPAAKKRMMKKKKKTTMTMSTAGGGSITKYLL
jgi:hypothetical protein